MRLFAALEQLWPGATPGTMVAKPGSSNHDNLNGGNNSSHPGKNLEEQSRSSGSQASLVFGDRSAAASIRIGAMRRNKYVATQPLYVPVAVGDSREHRATSNNVQEVAGGEPALSCENVISRIQTLLRPTTSDAREVC